MEKYLDKLLGILLMFIGIPFIVSSIGWIVSMFVIWEIYLPDIEWIGVRLYTVLATVVSLFLAADE
jgi:hypothetical protein